MIIYTRSQVSVDMASRNFALLGFCALRSFQRWCPWCWIILDGLLGMAMSLFVMTLGKIMNLFVINFQWLVFLLLVSGL